MREQGAEGMSGMLLWNAGVQALNAGEQMVCNRNALLVETPGCCGRRRQSGLRGTAASLVCRAQQLRTLGLGLLGLALGPALGLLGHLNVLHMGGHSITINRRIPTTAGRSLPQRLRVLQPAAQLLQTEQRHFIQHSTQQISPCPHGTPWPPSPCSSPPHPQSGRRPPRPRCCSPRSRSH